MFLFGWNLFVERFPFYDEGRIPRLVDAGLVVWLVAGCWRQPRQVRRYCIWGVGGGWGPGVEGEGRGRRLERVVGGWEWAKGAGVNRGGVDDGPGGDVVYPDRRRRLRLLENLGPEDGAAETIIWMLNCKVIYPALEKTLNNGGMPY